MPKTNDRRPHRSGPNIPEAQRHTVRVVLRLPPGAAESLESLAQAWDTTRSDAVARLVELHGRAR